jgi:hypothetical protein
MLRLLNNLKIYKMQTSLQNCLEYLAFSEDEDFREIKNPTSLLEKFRNLPVNNTPQSLTLENLKEGIAEALKRKKSENEKYLKDLAYSKKMNEKGNSAYQKPINTIDSYIVGLSFISKEIKEWAKE